MFASLHQIPCEHHVPEFVTQEVRVLMNDCPTQQAAVCNASLRQRFRGGSDSCLSGSQELTKVKGIVRPGK
jgi:hypothetical protein